jgi:hypothetical protein
MKKNIFLIIVALFLIFIGNICMVYSQGATVGCQYPYGNDVNSLDISSQPPLGYQYWSSLVYMDGEPIGASNQNESAFSLNTYLSEGTHTFTVEITYWNYGLTPITVEVGAGSVTAPTPFTAGFSGDTYIPAGSQGKWWMITLSGCYYGTPTFSWLSSWNGVVDYDQRYDLPWAPPNPGTNFGFTVTVTDGHGRIRTVQINCVTY